MNWDEQFLESDGVRHQLIGDSSTIRALIRLIGKVAPKNSTVLIQGESGTGKELVARALHVNSPRAHGPYVAVNCSELSENLIESELFGHERGSFTGAVRQHIGCFERAHQGTLFLDEIGDVSPAIQVKLLRVLEQRQLKRIGGSRSIDINIRLVTATNADLETLAARGKFRRDLYYRLRCIKVETPALRDRPEDVPLLAHHFVAKYAADAQIPVPAISQDALMILQLYDWPGNVRELRHVIEEAVVLREGDLIQAAHLPKDVLRPAGARTGTGILTMKEFVWKSKREYVERVLDLVGRDYKKAAELLDMPASGFHSFLRPLDLRHLL